MELQEGSEERATLQRRFGRGNLEKLVLQFEEDRANREWLDKSTMACPGCGVHTEKSTGCNHVCHPFYLPRDRQVIFEPHTDDLRKMLPALLLPVRGEINRFGSVRAFLSQGSPVLPKVV